jgi:hypothetical protein
MHVDVEVCQAVDCEFAESPYLAHQLPMFDDRQHVIEIPNMILDGLWRIQNSAVNARDSDLYLFRPLNCVIP